MVNPPFSDSAPKQSNTMPHITGRQEMKSVTIKATYKEDIIRFRVSMSSDLQECLEVCRTSRINLIRLSIHDIMSHLGSFCVRL
ncbi:hypothetical protein ACFXTI_014651 [Malus domestica]